MTQRKWLPEDWLDESVPKLGDDPADFVRPSEDGGYVLGLLPDDPERELRDDGGAWYDEALVDGQIVKFCFNDDFGWLYLNVDEDGSWRWDGAPPAAGNCFAIDGEIYEDVEEAIAHGNDGDPLEPGRHRLQVYHWSDGIAFRFVVASTGVAFVRCVEAQ